MKKNNKTLMIMVTLRDIDCGENTNTEVKNININENYIDKLENLYALWHSLWNGGDSYVSFADYLEYAICPNEYKELAEKRFDEIVAATISHDWTLESFVEIINAIYPDANAAIVQVANSIEFKY